jgi:iron complex outermembrane receptor protein
VGEQQLDNQNNARTRLEAYLVNDVRFMYQPGIKGLKEFKLTLLINNVFDEQYVSNGYVFFGQPFYYPQAGRNFLAGVSIGF